MPHRRKIEDWVKELVESELGGPPFAIGDVVNKDGRPVEIQEGQYWGDYGLSNFWTFREVLPDGSYGPEETGYGWNPNE